MSDNEDFGHRVQKIEDKEKIKHVSPKPHKNGFVVFLLKMSTFQTKS